jgi:DNA invertase Pin-like site-specific DNA recombinase
VTQALDTDHANPVGRAMLGMLQVFSEFEKELINERVRSGVKRYQAEYSAGRAQSKSGRNLPIGRPKSIFRVDEALRLRNEGVSWRKIAQQLGVPEATVRARCAENRRLGMTEGPSKDELIAV